MLGVYRPPETGDVDYIARHMREADRAEVIATRGPVLMRDALARAVLVSSDCWTGITPAGVPVRMFGVAPIDLRNGIGAPWMLASVTAPG